ncbi:MAG: transcriptional regulator, LysR family [Ilumatobacteraceae bacterium]|nr:transcriptional regulator, LysR family [Ilumatobacteraceae bacterium]
MLDIRRLQALQAVARHGSIAAAARSLHFTAPAISQQLAALERDTQATLFHRTARSIRLTEDGVLLAAHADVVLSQLESATNALAAHRAPAGPLRIAAFPTAISGLLAPALQTMAARHPGVVATVIDAEPDVADELVRNEQVDIAISHHYDLVPRAVSAAFETTTLYDEPMLFVRAASVVGGAGPIDIATMRTERWILPPLGTTCHEHVQRACGAAGFVPEIAAQCTEYHGALALVRAGLGVALVPAIALDGEERFGLDVLPTSVPLRRYVSVRASTGRSSSSIRTLIEALHASAADVADRVNSVAAMETRATNPGVSRR